MNIIGCTFCELYCELFHICLNLMTIFNSLVIWLAVKMAQEKAFQSDIDFCPQCGTILPLPESSAVVMCPRCHYAIDAKGKSTDFI